MVIASWESCRKFRVKRKTGNVFALRYKTEERNGDWCGFKTIVILINRILRVVVQSSVVLFLNVGSLPDISMNQLLMFFRWTEERIRGKDERRVRKRNNGNLRGRCLILSFPILTLKLGESFLCGRDGRVCLVFSHKQTWTPNYSVGMSELVMSKFSWNDRDWFVIARKTPTLIRMYLLVKTLWTCVWHRNDWSDCRDVTRPAVFHFDGVNSVQRLFYHKYIDDVCKATGH